MKKTLHGVLLYNMSQTREVLSPQVAEVIDDTFYDEYLFSLASDEPSDKELRDLEAEADAFLAAHAETDQRILVPEADDVVETEPLRAYFRSIGNVALLKAEEEVSLAQQMEAGLLAERALADPSLRRSLSNSHKTGDLMQIAREGAAAKDHFYRANLLLVVWHAKRLGARRDHRQSLLDLIQWGNMGLMNAVERFDYARGVKFSTYASYWIRKMLFENRRQNLALSATENAASEIERMNKITNAFFAEQGRAPNRVELAKLMGVSDERLHDLMTCRQEALQLNGPGRSNDADSTEPLLAMLAGEDDAETPALRILMSEKVLVWLDDVLMDLTGRYHRGPQYADFVRRRFGLSGPAQTREELAEFYGKHTETMRLWENKSLDYIRTRALQDKDKLT